MFSKVSLADKCIFKEHEYNEPYTHTHTLLILEEGGGRGRGRDKEERLNRMLTSSVSLSKQADVCGGQESNDSPLLRVLVTGFLQKQRPKFTPKHDKVKLLESSGFYK
jgi:hypothetical protein